MINDPRLRYFWFKTKIGLGLGVTAYSLEDAMFIINKQAVPYLRPDELEVLEVVEDVKVQDLDQGKVIPNMHPIIFRGIWFPKLAPLR